MNNINFFNISDGIDIIKIYKNFLVFDTHNKKMYEISKTAFKILKSCESGKSLYSITREVDLLIEFLKKCENLGIGQFDIIRNKRHKNTFLKNKIDMVWLVITDYCNYKCLHCYESAKNQTLVEKLQIRDYKRFLNLLTQKYEIGCIQITGGEPLARGKTFIFDLIYEIKNAATLASVTGAWIKDGDMYLYGYGGVNGYNHMHNASRSLHIWYGDKL